MPSYYENARQATETVVTSLKPNVAATTPIKEAVADVNAAHVDTTLEELIGYIQAAATKLHNASNDQLMPSIGRHKDALEAARQVGPESVINPLKAADKELTDMNRPVMKMALLLGDIATGLEGLRTGALTEFAERQETVLPVIDAYTAHTQQAYDAATDLQSKLQ